MYSTGCLPIGHDNSIQIFEIQVFVTRPEDDNFGFNPSFGPGDLLSKSGSIHLRKLKDIMPMPRDWRGVV
jgi:hypothetical protein